MLTDTNVVMGTAAYIAPEQQEGHADQRADIYALGVMLCEILCGQRPSDAFDPPSHRVQVDVRLDEVVIKAMQQQPERRFATAGKEGGEGKTAVSNRCSLVWIIAACLTLAGAAGASAESQSACEAT